MEAALLVASAGTITILTDQFDSAASGFVLVRTIITRMATGTIRLIGRKLPVDKVRIGQVACRTLQISTMIQWLKRQP